MIELSPASLLRAVSAVACIFLLLRAISCIKSILWLLNRFLRWAEDRMHSYQTFCIPRFDGLQENPLYRKAITYVASLPGVEGCDSADLFSSDLRSNDFSVKPAAGQIVHDSFLRSRISWICLPEGGFSLRIRRRDRHRILRPYLQHVEEIELRRKEIRMHTNTAGRSWRAMTFTHPATLETVAMDPQVKSRLQADLEGFLKDQGYYARIGRVWRRSYLLCGAPGTGKSTFAAAMARFLCYDVYDLDLSLVSNAGELRLLLLDTTRQSIILIEDLDRYLARPWMLNAFDGVFSCCGEERVMVFTAREGNNIVDGPSMKRPSWIDVRVHFPLCDFTAFKALASSFLGVQDHKLYPRVEEGFQNGGRLTPAEVGEIMIAHRGSPSRAIKSVINALHRSSSFNASKKIGWDGFPAERRGSEKGETTGCASGSIGKNSSVNEWRKFYGFIRLRSGIGKEKRTLAGATAATVVPAGEVRMNRHPVNLAD